MTSLSLDLDETLWRLESVMEQAERATHEYLQAHNPVLASAHLLERLRALRSEIAQADPGMKHDVTALRIRSLDELSKVLKRVRPELALS